MKVKWVWLLVAWVAGMAVGISGKHEADEARDAATSELRQALSRRCIEDR